MNFVGYRLHSDQDHEQPLLPRLEVLVLDNVQFRRGGRRDDDEGVLQRLRDLLRARQERNRELKRLVVQGGCCFDQEEVESMQGLVGTVDWDNEETWC